MNDTARELDHYEYRFETTPRYLVINEEVMDGVALPQWQLYDVFLKYLDNGAFVFVPVFRRKLTPTPKGVDENDNQTNFGASQKWSHRTNPYELTK